MLKNYINKHKIGILVILLLVFLIHAVLVSNGYTFYAYERFRDISVATIALILCIYNIKYSLKESRNWVTYLIIANLFVLIFVIHILRLLFGGLQC